MPWPALLVVLALPRLVKVWPYFRRPPPDEPPPNFPVWPLWYAALAWLHVRQAGALLVLGLAIGAVLRNCEFGACRRLAVQGIAYGCDGYSSCVI